MSTMLPRKDWKAAKPRLALTPTQVVAGLAKLPGWSLTGSEAQLVIEKTYKFANYFETMAFVNAVAFVAHVSDHHPELLVQYSCCVVKFNTHDVKGISETDLECALEIDSMLAKP